MQWAWDPRKAKKNLAKHKVTFELAERALGDPLAVTFPNAHYGLTHGEDRWTTIGSPSAEGGTVLYVVHTLPDDGDEARIISARKATSHERLNYEERQ